MQPLIIPFRSQMIRLALGLCVFFFLLSLSLMLMAAYAPLNQQDPEEAMRIGQVGGLLFGGLSIWCWVSLRRKRVGLLLNEEGLTSEILTMKVGPIAWEEIDGVEIVGKLLVIRVVEGEKWLDRAENPATARMMRMRMDQLGTPLAIPGSALGMTMGEIRTLIRRQQQMSAS